MPSSSPTSSATPEHHVVVLSTADFDSSVWTNKQHLAVRLAESMPVTYVGSIGLRRPRLNMSDARRLLQRLGLSRTNTSESEKKQRGDGRGYSNLTEHKPRLIPFHGNLVVDAINKMLIRRYVPRRSPSVRRVLWTFSPIDLGLADQFDFVVYHSVDLLHTVAGTPTAALLAAERKIAHRADAVIASSRGVARHLQDSVAINARLWENVADTTLFKISSGRQARAIFAGHLTPTKVDVRLLFDVAEAGINLVIAGPISVDGTEVVEDLPRLLKYPNVEYLGNLSLPDLADHVNKSSIGLIPYLLNEYTEGVFPMKVFEYLSAGLAVVSTALPSLEHQEIDGLHIVEGETFGDRVVDELRNFSEIEAQSRSRQAQSHSWDKRVQSALDLIQYSAFAARSDSRSGA